jgi:hypothetical protein
MLHINPKMLPRMAELEADLKQRRDEALTAGWLGEIEGIDLTLSFLREKRGQAQRLEDHQHRRHRHAVEPTILDFRTKRKMRYDLDLLRDRRSNLEQFRALFY